MSKDKRKRFQRACELLREANCAPWPQPTMRTLTGGSRAKWGTRNPTIRYILERGMARLGRIPKAGRRSEKVFNTVLDTGVAWAPASRP
jgi:hypothetical protein